MQQRIVEAYCEPTPSGFSVTVGCIGADHDERPRGPGVRLERMSPACVCLFHDFDGWCHVSGTRFLADFRQSDWCVHDSQALEAW